MELQAELEAARGEAEDRAQRLAEAERRATATSAELDAARSHVASLQSRAEKLTGRIQELSTRADELLRSRSEIRERSDQQAVELQIARSQLSAARDRWDEDRHALAQAKAALSTVLGQLHDAASNPLLLE